MVKRHGQTPWSNAAIVGRSERHEAIAKLLTAKDVVDPDCKDKFGRTPLKIEAGFGENIYKKYV